MEAYKNRYGTILIDDPESKEVKVWRNFWSSFRVCLGLYILGIITSLILGNVMGLIGEKIKPSQLQQPNTLEQALEEPFSLSNVLSYLGFTFGGIASPFIINWHLKSQAKKRWINKYAR